MGLKHWAVRERRTGKLSSASLYAIDRKATTPVRTPTDGLPTVQHRAIEDLDTHFRRQRLEIPNGENPHVRRVMPLIRQRFRHGHTSLQHGEPMPPVAEVRERDNAFTPDAYRFAQDGGGLRDGLQRLRQDREVEA